jgi:hypothetical protein
VIEGGIQKIMEILEFIEDIEIIANSCKIIRICIRDELIYDRIAQQFPNLPTLLIDKLTKWNSSLPIVQESASALRNYVRKPEYARTLKPEAVDIIVELARDVKFEKIKPALGNTLKMMSKIPELDQRIKLRNATDLTVL